MKILVTESQYNRIFNEQLVNSAPNARKESKILERLLQLKSYEGVCGIRFGFDIGKDKVRSVDLEFSSEWYRSNDNSEELKKKFLHMEVVKDDFEKVVKQMLGLENLYIGSSLVDNCK
jgi:hypothetical protein